MALNNLKSVSEKKDQEILEKFDNFDAEIAIIGCLLWDNRSYEKLADFLKEEHFTDNNNQKIFLKISPDPFPLGFEKSFKLRHHLSSLLSGHLA